MSVFTTNIESLKKTNPLLVQKLLDIKDVQNYEIYQGESDPAQINYINTNSMKAVYNHPVEDSLKEIEKLKKFENYPILYFFGLGNGIFYKMLLSNQKLEKVVVYEPDIEIIYITLNLIDISEELNNQKIEIFLVEDYNYPNAVKLLENWQFRFYLKLYDLYVLTPYYSDYQEEILTINEINVRAIKQIVISHGNDATDSLIGIKHHLHNIPEMVQNYKFTHLIKKRNSDIAIIVSTGPSLAKQLPLLKKIQNFATIISVDASLPILEKNGIKPDIVTILERVELTSKFFAETSDEFMKDIIFVIASLAHKKTIDEIKGRKVITMRPFPFNRFFKMKEFGYLGIDMSAANMAYELTYMMGYAMTIFVGQDLAYAKDGISHSKGHVLGEKDVKPREDDFYIPAYGGEGKVKTTKVWNLFRNGFEKAISETTGKMVTINSTEGGARIEGATEIPFAEIIKNLKTKKTDIKLRIPTNSNIDKNFQHSIKKIEYAIKFGTKHKQKIEKLFLEVAEIWDNLVYLNQTNQLEKINFKKLYKTSDKIDKLKNIFSNTTFQELFFDISQSFIVNYELELAMVQVKKVSTEEEKQAKIVDWIMKHKEWLFTLAGAVDSVIFQMEKELTHIKTEYRKFKGLK